MGLFTSEGAAATRGSHASRTHSQGGFVGMPPRKRSRAPGSPGERERARTALLSDRILDDSAANIDVYVVAARVQNGNYGVGMDRVRLASDAEQLSKRDREKVRTLVARAHQRGITSFFSPQGMQSLGTVGTRSDAQLAQGASGGCVEEG